MSLAAYTRMLRRSDEISYRAVILGIVKFTPDEAKTLYYAGQRIARMQEKA